jgi:hypothetical protein
MQYDHLQTHLSHSQSRADFIVAADVHVAARSGQNQERLLYGKQK